MKNRIIPLFNIPSQISPEESELLKKREELMDELLTIFALHGEEPAGRGCGYGVSGDGYKEAWELIVSMNVQFGEN